MLMALNPPDFTLSYGGDVWGAVSILLFPPMYGTLLCRWITKRGVWACILAGAAAILVLYHSTMPDILASILLPGVLISTAAMAVVSLLDRRRGEEV